MDFAISTFDNTPPLLTPKPTPINNHQHGSGLTKQERSEPDPPDDQQQQQLFLRPSKSSKTDCFDQPNNASKTMAMRSDMLSFSSSSSSSSSTNAIKDGSQSSVFSFYQPSPAYIRNTGYGSGGLQAGMQMPVSRYKGPFTPSQWLELEHQALIYKHFVSNVPVPSHLLNPLRKSVNTFLFAGSSSSTAYAPNSYGWGTFHLGFSGNTDPEPGRCRRTDGKKWRCSRDAVPDQKYCERHINRGRHRSRKPVEGQNGHAVSGPKVGPVVSSSSVPVSGGRASAATTAAAGNQFKTLHHRNAAIASSTDTNRIQELQAFAIPKQNNPVEESSDSLIYPTNYNSFLDRGPPNPLPDFVDQWSKVQSGRTAWPEELKPDWTQLSMSIPVASSDFSSSSNSPAQEKLAVAPLGLSHEFDLDPTHKQASNWIPISWGSSMGGPLGEVLNRTSSSNGVTSKNVLSSSSASEMWDHVNNYQLGSSPTGVLQKTTFVSLSNSSSGGSPKGGGGGGLCDELLLSTLAS